MSDWRSNVLQAIKKPEALVRNGETNKFIMQAHVPPSFIYLLERVTAELDYSNASWMRRAVAVQLSSQLGIPLSQILGTTTQVRRRGVSIPRYPDNGYDDLADIGLFCPHPDCKGDHFRD